MLGKIMDSLKLLLKSAKLKGKFFSRDFDVNYRFITDEDVEGIDTSISLTSIFILNKKFREVFAIL